MIATSKSDTKANLVECRILHVVTKENYSLLVSDGAATNRIPYFASLKHFHDYEKPYKYTEYLTTILTHLATIRPNDRGVERGGHIIFTPGRIIFTPGLFFVHYFHPGPDYSLHGPAYSDVSLLMG